MRYNKKDHEMLYEIYNIIKNNSLKEKFLDFIYDLEEFWTDQIEEESQRTYYNDVY